MIALSLYYLCFAEVVVQCFSQKRHKEQIDDGESYQTSDNDLNQWRFFTWCGDNPCIGKPFSGCAGKKAFKKGIIDKQDPEKEPAKIIASVSPVHYIPVPAMIAEISEREDDEGVDKEIQGAGAVSYCFHEANLVSGE